MAPNLPGFINSINPTISVGVGKRPYTFAWILGFVITSLVYLTLSAIWKPVETMIPRAILPDEVYDGEATGTSVIEGKMVGDHDVESSGDGKKLWKEEENELRVV